MQKPKAVKVEINDAHNKFGDPCEEILRHSVKAFNIELMGKLPSCEGCVRSKTKQKKVSHTTETKESFIGDRSDVDQ